MPIEIKELHIKINIEESRQTTDSETPKMQNQEELVRICLEQVMEILTQKEER